MPRGVLWRISVVSYRLNAAADFVSFARGGKIGL
jgi:hypothetical protein